MIRALNSNNTNKSLLHITFKLWEIYRILCEDLEKQMQKNLNLTMYEALLLYKIDLITSLKSPVTSKELLSFAQSLPNLIYTLNSLAIKNLIILESINGDCTFFNIFISKYGADKINHLSNLGLNTKTSQKIVQIIESLNLAPFWNVLNS